MTLLESAASGILPDDFSDLIITTIADQALAFNPALATPVTTSAATFNIPSVEDDVAANWVTEGGEITPDDPTLGELPVTPAKVAGLTIISRELASDSSPDAETIVANSIARSIVGQVDSAWLGDLADPAPKGLASLTTSTGIATAGIANFDLFAAAVSTAEQEGGNVTGWVLNPAVALLVATLKTATGSNQTLTQTPREILGRPVFVSAKVPAETAWAVDASSAYTVLREDLVLAVSGDAYFSSDRIAIRTTTRVGFGFPKPAVITKLTGLAAS